MARLHGALLQTVLRSCAREVRELKRLVDEGYLILIGAGRGAHYRVGPVLARTLSK